MKEPNPKDLNRIDEANPRSDRRPTSALIGFAAVAVITATFVMQNRDRTLIHFLWFDVRARTWAAIAVAIVLGAALDRLFLAFWRRRKARRAAG